ncbi:hypothetical protein [Profundibacter sp.]
MEIKGSSIVIAIILVVAMPAVSSVVAYQITKDPTLRPLARTLNDEAIYNGTAVSTEIFAIIHWSTGREKSFTRRELSNAIHRAFESHGTVVQVVFKDVDTTDAVTITYKIGRNKLGPMRITRAADSINSAIAAYRMYQMAVPKRRASQ